MFLQKSVCEKSRWHVYASDVARRTRNPIREIVENLNFSPNPEKQLIALSIGDPTVFGNLKPAPEVISGVQNSLLSLKYNGYAPSSGYNDAREAVAKYTSKINGVDVEATDIVLCSGCSGALDLCVIALANPGQNILIPRPGFSVYRTLGEGTGIEFKYYDLLPNRRWEIDLDDLEDKIDANTVAIVVINPSNPCGSVYSEQHLRDVLAVASRNYVPIIADEIYEHLVFPDETYTSLGSLSDDVPILSCSGLSKRFLVPGWRLGWIVVHDRDGVLGQEMRKALQNLSQRIMGSNTLVQGALGYILQNTPQSYFDDVISVLYENATLAYEILKNTPGLSPVMPQGAMYMMVGIEMNNFPHFADGLHFVHHLVEEESVFCLPGECFNFPGYVRIVLTIPKELIEEACERISDFCLRYYKKIITNSKE